MPASVAAGTTTPDPWKQVPLMVGDWIDYAGTVYKINPLGPNTAANMWVSVHTVVAHLGVRTTLGTQPAYIYVESFLFGVGDRNGGPTVSAGITLPPPSPRRPQPGSPWWRSPLTPTRPCQQGRPKPPKRGYLWHRRR